MREEEYLTSSTLGTYLGSRCLPLVSLRPFLSPSPFSSPAACRSHGHVLVFMCSPLLPAASLASSVPSFSSFSLFLPLSISPSLALHYASLHDGAHLRNRRARARKKKAKKGRRKKNRGSLRKSARSFARSPARSRPTGLLLVQRREGIYTCAWNEREERVGSR